MKRRAMAMIVVVDFLAAIVLMQQAIIARSTVEHRKPTVRTFGTYAVVMTWPHDNGDDLDLYVQDPAGDIAWYAGQSAGEMHLEHDDLATSGSSYAGQAHFERVVIRGNTAGEYVANVHVYQATATQAPVTVELWRLEGRDARVMSRRLVMHEQGDEQTAFRWSVDAAGNVTDRNRLPKSLLQEAAQ